MESLWKLLSDKKKITIPIIQRDYAQGRSTPHASVVRENFLNDIFKVLENNDNLRLDFVYGTRAASEFVPFDGQQRLTTLYLLHCYLSLYLEENMRKEASNVLSRFSYHTRDYSKEFCEFLTLTYIDTFELNKLTKNKISLEIRDNGNFHYDWMNDPTVEAMLIMLDDIHMKFLKLAKENPEKTGKLYWQRLTYDGCIDFYILDMNAELLSDNVYIKMNARGKSLTSFENFKAELIKQFKLLGGDTHYPSFSQKLDGDWTDLFWSFRGSDNKIDNNMLNFIKFVLNIEYIQNIGMDSEEFLGNNEVSIINDFRDAIGNKKITIKSFKLLYELLNILHNRYMYNGKKVDSLEIKLSNNIFYDEIKLLESVCGDRISLKQRIIATFLYSVLLKFNNTPNVENILKECARLIYNVTQYYDYFKDYRIEDYINFSGKLDALIANIDKNGGSVITYLSNETKDDIFSFGKEQVCEEILKAKLISDVNSGNQWANVIYQAEGHKYFDGAIKFIFALATNNGQLLINDFNKYNKVAQHLFNDKGPKEESLLRAALLCYDDYKISNGYGAFSYLYNDCLAKERDKCSWKVLLENQKLNKGFCDDYFNKLQNGISCRTILETIISNAPNMPLYSSIPEWRKYIIKHPDSIGGKIFQIVGNTLIYAVSARKRIGGAITEDLLFEGVKKELKKHTEYYIYDYYFYGIGEQYFEVKVYQSKNIYRIISNYGDLSYINTSTKQGGKILSYTDIRHNPSKYLI